MSDTSNIIPADRIAAQVFSFRGHNVMLDNDFMFRLNDKEFKILKSHIATTRRGGRRTAPRAFTRLRHMLASNETLAQKIKEHDNQITYLYDELNKLLTPPEPGRKRAIGFQVNKDKK